LGYWSFAQRFGLFKSGNRHHLSGAVYRVGLGAFPGVIHATSWVYRI
jgi:hypothetical protein